MTTRPTSRSLRAARAAAIAVAVAVLAGVAAMAVHAAGAKPNFTIAASPASQTVTPGDSATYTVDIGRLNGFSGAVSLTATRLPRGTTASFQPQPIPGGGTAATLTVSTSTSTPAGTRQIRITGTSGGIAHGTWVTLIVQPTALPDYAVAVSPATRPVAPGGTTSFAVTVSRSGGFAGAVDLHVHGLPKKATGTFAPATVSGSGTTASLDVAAAANTPTGSFSVEIRGTAQIGSKTIVHSAFVTLVVQPPVSFGISGSPAGDLAPGVTRPLDLRVSNTTSFDITVTAIGATVDAVTSVAACNGTANFATAPYSGPGFVIPAGAANVTLTSLGVPQAHLPTVSMLNLATNQDACKGADLTLHFDGSATA
jgi:hypothetical protein